MIRSLMASVALASSLSPVAAPVAASKSYDATNWAGMVAGPQKVVSGQWTVDATVTSTEADEWVGQGGWGSSTINQAGVQVQTNGAWAWVEEYPAPPRYIHAPVHFGDRVGVVVSARSIRINDFTAGWGRKFRVRGFDATTASSDWIVETHDTTTAPDWSMRGNWPTGAYGTSEPRFVDNTQNGLRPSVDAYGDLQFLS